MAEIGPIAQTGALSTQVEAIQRPFAEEAPVEQTQEAAPVPPPEDSGRGQNLDTTA